MRFHKSLVLLSVANFFCCTTVFYFLRRFADESTQLINTAIGWIFWLGIFALIAPLFLSDDTRRNLFSAQYFGGTIILSIINILATIGGNLLSAILIQ